MSHTATVKVSFENREILKQVCTRLGIKFTEGQHIVNLYSEKISTNFSIQLPGWKFPVAICGDELKYDHYNGVWGSLSELERLQNQYCRDIAIQQAQAAGFGINESVDESGDITLELVDYNS